MIANKQVSGLLIGSSLGVAIILIMLPLPDWAVSFRPAFFVTTVLFWVLMQPLRFGIFTAWLCGILIDVLYGTPLSQHGVALAVAAYIVVKMRDLLWIIPYWQQPLLILPVFIVYEFILFWIDGIIGYDVSLVHRCIFVVSSTLLWPFWAASLERIAETDV